MKKQLFMILGIMLLLSGCKSYAPIARESGKADIAFLIFTSNGAYNNKTVHIILNGKTDFDAKVVKARKSSYKGNVYPVPVGKNRVKVIYNGETLYNKELFISTQETRIIPLP